MAQVEAHERLQRPVELPRDENPISTRGQRKGALDPQELELPIRQQRGRELQTRT